MAEWETARRKVYIFDDDVIFVLNASRAVSRRRRSEVASDFHNIIESVLPLLRLPAVTRYPRRIANAIRSLKLSFAVSFANANRERCAPVARKRYIRTIYISLIEMGDSVWKFQSRLNPVRTEHVGHKCTSRYISTAVGTPTYAFDVVSLSVSCYNIRPKEAGGKDDATLVN